MDLKDGTAKLEEEILQVIRDEDVHILLCRDFNARTGCQQPKLDDMSNYSPVLRKMSLVVTGLIEPKDIVVNKLVNHR